jgi:hypothetical protein
MPSPGSLGRPNQDFDRRDVHTRRVGEVDREKQVALADDEVIEDPAKMLATGPVEVAVHGHDHATVAAAHR